MHSHTVVTDPQLIEKYTPIALRVKSLLAQLSDIRSQVESNPSVLSTSNKKLFQLLIELVTKEIQILDARNQKDQIYERIVNYTLKIFVEFMTGILNSNETVSQEKINLFLALTWNSLINDFQAAGVDNESIQNFKNIALIFGIDS